MSVIDQRWRKLVGDKAQQTDGLALAGPPARRFTVRDFMIFVASMAVGVFGFRANDTLLTEKGWHWDDSVLAIEGVMMLTGPGLAGLTMGLAVARLLSPRPPRIELFRQPGFVAACVALTLTARRFAQEWLVDRVVTYDDWFSEVEWESAIQDASLGILVAWSVLALAGCLKAERGWVDRSSSAVALLWVLAGIASRVVLLIESAWFENP